MSNIGIYKWVTGIFFNCVYPYVCVYVFSYRVYSFNAYLFKNFLSKFWKSWNLHIPANKEPSTLWVVAEMHAGSAVSEGLGRDCANTAARALFCMPTWNDLKIKMTPTIRIFTYTLGSNFVYVNTCFDTYCTCLFIPSPSQLWHNITQCKPSSMKSNNSYYQPFVHQR